jgi:hypothetical protein
MAGTVDVARAAAAVARARIQPHKLAAAATAETESPL